VSAFSLGVDAVDKLTHFNSMFIVLKQFRVECKRKCFLPFSDFRRDDRNITPKLTM
jgi:hypothetical protein